MKIEKPKSNIVHMYKIHANIYIYDYMYSELILYRVK